MSFKDNSLIVKCFQCEKNYTKDFNKELINKLANSMNFATKALINLLLRKDVYPYQHNFMKHHCLIKKLFTVS